MELPPADYDARVLPDPLPAVTVEAVGAAPTAVVSDLLSALGMTPHHVQGLLPIESDAPVRMAGRAITVEFWPTAQAVASGRPLYSSLEVLNRSRQGDVIVMSTGRAPLSFWGENMVELATGHGVAGAVLDGCIRDRAAIRRSGFPLFASGFSPRSSMDDFVPVAYNDVVTVGELAVTAGDLVLGDEDGVIVVPRAAVGVVAELVKEFERLEEQLAAAMASGEPPADVYSRFHTIKAETVRRVATENQPDGRTR